MKRDKKNVEYWNKRISSLFELAPEMSLVAKRYDSLKLLLQEKYPFIKEQENHIQFLKDVVYLDRLIRKETEDQEIEKKKILSDQYVVDNYIKS